MDNKFDEIEDIIIDDSEEVPVYEAPVEEINEPAIEPVEPLPEYEEPIIEQEVQNYENSVDPVKPLPEYEEPTIEQEDPSYEDKVEPVKPLPDYEEPNEHPNGKIVLKKEKEEEKELVDVGDFKLTDNKSLMFVIVVGIIIFVAIMILPKLFY